MQGALATLLVVIGMAISSEAQDVARVPQTTTSVLTGEFKFFLAGAMDRTVSFFNEYGGGFSYGCWRPDCSFIVGELAISGASIDVGPGIVFKLSEDGSFLTTTCKSSACTVVISQESMSADFSPSFSVTVKNLKNSETLDIRTKARVLFTVKK